MKSKIEFFHSGNRGSNPRGDANGRVMACESASLFSFHCSLTHFAIPRASPSSNGSLLTASEDRSLSLRLLYILLIIRMSE